MTTPKPVSIFLDDRTRERYVDNIVDVFHSATHDQEIRGRVWYRVAHDMADMIAEGDIRTGAGVIAALSPQTSWEDNAHRAKSILATGVISGHTGNALAKVAKIMAGADPEDVLPMSLKTGHFYRCILDPADPDAVVIDRHAHDIAVGVLYGSTDRGLSSPRRYALLAHVYREAAQRLNELPQTVQAVCWTVWRERSH